jgi:hypothetical protein
MEKSEELHWNVVRRDFCCGEGPVNNGFTLEVKCENVVGKPKIFNMLPDFPRGKIIYTHRLVVASIATARRLL